ncbi:lysophospholipid acyltransferase family protein [Jannaschia seohaensis]|uniref:1-acyl-sn-glycerol-3-phosphate acyltransferase n=1 Tax=Jannaschia seohaensis TaxID=475081 RepID=A0A2Y9ABA9_9RHOB|nr:lysophospholipid acyltransferase family protein [Jannaschia seohaensis]PWJ20836.1 1-acyl-sn-glycerol-3-phosphate acyltransferase [Jannaschia seohaensis]SSA41246.1 1-acyl-sn-glycerol-3-phosphate acyltransferase [Jannaschia seohaensis]
MTWDDAPHPVFPPLGPLSLLRVFVKGGAMLSLIFGGLVVLLLVRLVEQPLCGGRRPVTPHITVFVCRNALRLLGLRRLVRGTPMDGAGAVVANHVSWLDIFALNACRRVYFVSKSEVAGWPGIGWLARATGTVFIRRDRREARTQTDLLQQRLAVGHELLFFPEGTSTDGRRVLPFKSSLFASFLAEGTPSDLRVQPVTLSYHAPEGAPAAFYGWWGDQSAGTHMVAMLAAARHGTVEVIFHPPLEVAAFADRKALARRAEAIVRAGLEGSGVPMLEASEA